MIKTSRYSIREDLRLLEPLMAFIIVSFVPLLNELFVNVHFFFFRHFLLYDGD